MADDIGEALDFVVGLAKIGGALVDGGFEIEVVVAQQRFGMVTRARRAPHQKNRDAGQHDNEARADAVSEAARVWLRSAPLVRRAKRRSSSARIWPARSSMCLMASRPVPRVRSGRRRSVLRLREAMVARNSSIR